MGCPSLKAFRLVMLSLQIDIGMLKNIVKCYTSIYCNKLFLQSSLAQKYAKIKIQSLSHLAECIKKFGFGR
jgi:hypothetical protein